MAENSIIVLLILKIAFNQLVVYRQFKAINSLIMIKKEFEYLMENLQIYYIKELKIKKL